MDDRGEDPNPNRFVPILLYVLGFMGALALAALVVGWLMRHL
jgi:hypothetical protein